MPKPSTEEIFLAVVILGPPGVCELNMEVREFRGHGCVCGNLCDGRGVRVITGYTPLSSAPDISRELAKLVADFGVAKAREVVRDGLRAITVASIGDGSLGLFDLPV
jgi:hypothetical protein